MGRPQGAISHPRKGDLKWCYVCQRYKHISQFGRNGAKTDGLAACCRTCRTNYERDYQHQYYLQHRDKLLPKHHISAMESYRRRNNQRVMAQ